MYPNATPLMIAMAIATAAGPALAPASTAATPADDRARYEGHGFLPLEGTRLFHEVAGHGAPVVLIHGGGMDSRVWEPQFKRWTREFRVVRYDARGFGGSAPSTAPFRHDEDLVALLDALGIEKAHLVGLSLGGMIASDCAVAHPERVASLVLSGSGLSGFDPESSEEQARYYDAVRAARDLGLDSLEVRWLRDPLMTPAMEQPHLRPLLRRLTRENQPSWTQNWLLARQLRPPTAARLGEVRVPTLLLVGDRDVPSVRACVDSLARGIAGARLVVIPGAGHMLNLERPEQFDEAALGFLRKASGAPTTKR